jgi:hypothetical protein
MKTFLLLIGFFLTSAQAQTTFFNDSVGSPLGTSSQIGRTTYYNDPTGAPLGTANQVGRITYYNDSTGALLGTTISPQPAQPYHVPQFNNQPIPRVPVAPLYPARVK